MSVNIIVPGAWSSCILITYCIWLSVTARRPKHVVAVKVLLFFLLQCIDAIFPCRVKGCVYGSGSTSWSLNEPRGIFDVDHDETRASAGLQDAHPTIRPYTQRRRPQFRVSMPCCNAVHAPGASHTGINATAAVTPREPKFTKRGEGLQLQRCRFTCAQKPTYS